MYMPKQERDPKLDACDKEVADVLAKYGKAIRPVPFIRPDGGIDAQIIYFDVEVPKEKELATAESPLVV